MSGKYFTYQTWFRDVCPDPTCTSDPDRIQRIHGISGRIRIRIGIRCTPSRSCSSRCRSSIFDTRAEAHGRYTGRPGSYSRALPSPVFIPGEIAVINVAHLSTSFSYDARTSSNSTGAVTRRRVKPSRRRRSESSDGQNQLCNLTLTALVYEACSVDLATRKNNWITLPQERGFLSVATLLESDQSRTTFSLHKVTV